MPRRALCVSILLIPTLPFISAQDGKTYAVTDFESRAGISASEAGSLTDILRAELVKTGQVTLLERGQMQQILEEQNFQLTGCTSDECAVEIGRLLSVNTMVAGSIGKVGATFSIVVRIIDVQTGKIDRTIIRGYRGELYGLLTEMVFIAGELVGVEVPEVVTEEEPPEPTKKFISRDKQIIAVLDFDALGISQQEAQILTNRVRATLIQSNIYTVIDHGHVQEFLDEQDFQVHGDISNEEAAIVGMIAGASLVMAGSISKIGSLWSIEMRIIDVASSKTTKSSSYDTMGDIQWVLTKGIPEAVRRITE
ncbi:MAG: hypothetical protein IH971_07615 [Candidatus Marinimicrobia bacterium]|nr:hypothetical protein [Candidatus Neomarinimicrobiota bacterium]